MTFCEEILCNAWSPPSDVPAWKWVEENVELGNDSDLKGKVSFDWVPMSRFFLDACQNPRVKKVTKMTSSQSAKTKNVEFYVMWKVKNQPGETIWYQDDNIAAKTFFKTRLYPDLEDCELIRPLLPTRRDKKSQTLIQFDTMNLYVLGANKKTNRERITAGTVLCDEIRNYPVGAMQGIRNRYKTIRNYKEIIFSVAGIEGDILHESFEEGSRHLFFWACPHCKHKQTFRFGRKASVLYPKPRDCGGVVWDDNPITHPSEDVWNFEELGKTVRYECENPACKHRFHNSEKLELLKSLEPIQTNPMAAPDHISMHWNEMYMPWEQCDWDKIVAKFLRAHIAYKRGDKEPLKVIVQETFGEPWVDEDTAVRVLPVTETQVTEKKFWERQDYAFMEVDVQRKGFWVLVQAWSKTGEDYNAWAGELRTWGEVESKQMEYGIQGPCVFVDCGDGNKEQEIFMECARHGWIALKGEDRPGYDYIYKKGKNAGKKVRLPFSWPAITVDPCYGLRSDDPNIQLLAGKTCIMHFWSNTWIKDIATARRAQMELGRLSYVGPNVGPDFPKQIYSEHKQKFYDRDNREEWRYVVIGKRQNHLWDAYCMGVLAACRARIIGDGTPKEQNAN